MTGPRRPTWALVPRDPASDDDLLRSRAAAEARDSTMRGEETWTKTRQGRRTKAAVIPGTRRYK
ncbi:hypothetical protein IMZ48_43055 [Candidatus Bathyarchaeota archaeon]|nr:hypothetical protein [Candidatus Bathyarchaeota archaeon]